MSLAMDYLPLYLGGFGILVLGIIGFAWWQNEQLKKKLITQTVNLLQDNQSLKNAGSWLLSQNLTAEQATAILELAHLRLLVTKALVLLNERKTEDETKTIMVNEGAKPASADEAIGTALFHKFCQDNPVVGLFLGVVLPLIGLAVMAGGIFLWYGNKSGLFVTFPYAGHFTIAIGVVMVVFGVRFLVRSMSNTSNS